MIGIDRIRQIIPHRDPILLIDQVIDLVPGERLTARKAVSSAEPCYRGLTDDSPAEAYAYPGYLMVESVAQAAVLLAVWDQPNPDVTVGKVELAGAIDDVRFLAPVYPGDVLEHRVRLVKGLGDTTLLAGETWVGATQVMTVGQFVLALRSIESLV